MLLPLRELWYQVLQSSKEMLLSKLLLELLNNEKTRIYFSLNRYFRDKATGYRNRFFLTWLLRTTEQQEQNLYKR